MRPELNPAVPEAAARLHRAAMGLAEAAASLSREGFEGDARTFAREALRMEIRAVDALPGGPCGPEGCALHHAAASMALACGEPRAAVEIIERALARGLAPGLSAEMRALRSAAFRLIDGGEER